jgi:hypothetical protein
MHIWAQIFNKAGWPNGKALDYESRDCRFDPCVGQYFCYLLFCWLCNGPKMVAGSKVVPGLIEREGGRWVADFNFGGFAGSVMAQKWLPVPKWCLG